MTHLCHAEGCTVAVPPRMLMCRKHWGLVDRSTQAWVWRVYVPGQEIRKDPTSEYMEAQKAAVECVRSKEGKIAAQLSLGLEVEQ